MIVLSVISIMSVVLYLVFDHCLDRFIHAEEIIKHEIWEEEKMVDWSK